MAIKYYDLVVKKLVNFNGSPYIVLSDLESALALKLSESDFTIFANGITQLGTAAGKNYGSSAGNLVEVGTDGKISSSLIPVSNVGADLGKFDSWALAEAGVSASPANDDIIYIKDEGASTYSTYICTDATKSTFSEKFSIISSSAGSLSLAQYIAHKNNEGTEKHVTAEQIAAWNAKLDSADLIEGTNITLNVDSQTGAVTISCAYELPIATSSVLGGIKLGDGLSAQSSDATGATIEATAKLKTAITTNVACGNLAKGTTLDAGMTLNDILLQMLVTYINPGFASFTSSNLGGNVEVGTTVAGPIAFSWTYSDETYTFANIKDNTITLREDNASGTIIAENLSKNTRTYTSEITNLIRTTVGSKSFYIQGINTKDATFSKTLTKNWQYAYFYGVSNTAAVPSIADMRSATKALNPANNTTFTITANSGNAIAWFAYPATLRDPSSILALDSMNAEVKTAFTIITEEDFVIADGETKVSYKIGYIIPDEPFSQQARYKVTI